MNDYEDVDGVEASYVSNDDDLNSVEISTIPDRGLMVTAATVSLLKSDTDEDAFSRYQRLMGREPAAIPRAIQAEAGPAVGDKTEYYDRALLGIMGDPELDLARKEAALKAVQTGQVLDDDIDKKFIDASLITNPDTDATTETILNSFIDGFAEENAKWDEQRKLEQAVHAGDNGTVDKLADLLGMFVPMEDGITAFKMASRSGASLGESLQALVLPGSFRKNMQDRVENMTYEERLSFATQLADVVKNSDGLITGRNMIRAHTFFNDVMRGEIGTPGEYFDNVMNVLDFIPLVGSTVRGAVNLASGARRGSQIPELPPEAAGLVSEAAPVATPRGTAPAVTEVDDLASITSAPQLRANLTEIENTEAEIANLLGETSGKLDNSVVKQLQDEKKALQQTLKNRGTPDLRVKGAASEAAQARQNIQAQITRIDEQLASNAQAAKAEQALVAAEQKLATLKKDASTVVAQKASPLTDEISRIYRNNIMGEGAGAKTPANILEVVNAPKARALHANIALDETGELARAVAGTDRNTVLIKAVAPQVAAPNGKVAKVVDNKEGLFKTVLNHQFGHAVKNLLNGIQYTDAELMSARNAIKQTLYQNNGSLVINDAMTTIGFKGTNVEISAVYTHGNGGWSSSTDAIAQTKVALRRLGVKDSDIEVLKREGSTYVPVPAKSVEGIDGEYAIRLKMEHRITTGDITEWDELDVKRNWADRFITKGDMTFGSPARFMLNAASMLNRTLTGSMGVADASKSKMIAALSESFSEGFAKPFNKLPKHRQHEVENYLIEANVKEIPFDEPELLTKFSPEEVAVIREWRDTWDAMWVLENRDLVRSLNDQGFELFDHPNMKVFVKHRAKNFSHNRAYDPATDSIVKMDDNQIREFYDMVSANKGGIYETRNPITIKGQEVNHIIVRNQGNEVARRFRDDDIVLDYRDGYYKVTYKNARFIEKKDASGKWHAVAVTGDIQDAKRIVENLQKQDPTVEFRQRGDDRTNPNAGIESIDIHHAQGRTSQRHRGQLLEDSANLKQMGDLTYIESPADSAARAARSLGGRIAMREALQTAKERFLKQYGDLIVTRNAGGQPEFPATREGLHKTGDTTDGRLADARTTLEYIHQIEAGYVNAADGAIQRFFEYTANVAGDKVGSNVLEKTFRAASSGRASSILKGTTHVAVLVTNPIRAFFMNYVAAHRMIAYDAGAVFSGRAPLRAHDAIMVRIGLKEPSGDTANFLEWFGQTGLRQSIARDNLVRDTILAQSGMNTTTGRIKDATLGNLRKYGYDAAEELNYIIHGSMVYDKFRYTKKLDVNDPRVREDMLVELQAVTGNMNMADDMPYNQNALGPLFTYLQVVHKFLLSPFNRQLDGETRARLLFGDILAFGLPATLVDTVIGDNRELAESGVAEAAREGMLAFMLNRLMQTNMDYSSLRPWDMSSWIDLHQAAMTEKGWFSIVENSPFWRVMGLTPESKFGQALVTTYSYFKGLSDETSPEHMIPLTTALNAWAEISSGWTNAMRSQAILSTRRFVDKYGRVVDDDVSRMEAAMIAFGFPTKESSAYYDLIKIDNRKAAEEEGAARAKEMLRMIQRLSPNDPNSETAIRYFTKVMADAQPWANKQMHAIAMKRMFQELYKPANLKIMEKLMKEQGFMDLDEYVAHAAKAGHLDESQKEVLHRNMVMMTEQFEKLKVEYGK